VTSLRLRARTHHRLTLHTRKEMSTTATPIHAVADAVAAAVIAAFAALPRKCKPREREWAPLSGVVLEDGILSLT